ncbi:helix-turn-helix transcriptional regulator [Myceligenerans sp. I2]|uniref:Helix-turn-helix transcriptional regulator n=2 Tax=Myceligenerans indicum TaxID=2593663 RepID=A0ABS1LI98_9MICO|nr:helix-turn-helix transcriptional regulator [Myceligenerans indicum]
MLALEAVVAALRSKHLDDHAARAQAIEIASAELVRLRTATDERRTALIEPVTSAFSRLRTDLRPLARFGDLDVQFVEPPATGRGLPGDIAHEARAIVRSAVLALAEGGSARRVRVQWDCDGLHLLIEIRDDGAGELRAHDDAMRPIGERVRSVRGSLELESTSGWGSNLSIRIPLDPPATAARVDDSEDLTPREREVLRLVASGAPNAEIAGQLGVTVNTVKYHVGNLLRKHGARSRSALVALTR